FQRFFTVADARLDPDTPPGGLDLAFTIGPNALQLPAYLGGALLGSTQDLATVRVYGGLARTLNFLKTGDIDEIVQAVPIEARTGTVQVAFAPLEAEATWLITTPAEFRRARRVLRHGRHHQRFRDRPAGRRRRHRRGDRRAERRDNGRSEDGGGLLS